MQNKNLSKSQWYQLILKFEKREESCTRFCKIHNISPSAIYKWRRYFHESSEQGMANENSKSKNFIPINIDHSNSKINQNSLSNSAALLKNSSPLSLEDSSRLSKLSSSFKISKSDLSLEFVKGCSVLELRAILEIINAAK